MTDPSPRPRPVWTDETEPPADHAPTCHGAGELDPAHCARCRSVTLARRRTGPPNLDTCPAARRTARAVAALHRERNPR